MICALTFILVSCASKPEVFIHKELIKPSIPDSLQVIPSLPQPPAEDARIIDYLEYSNRAQVALCVLENRLIALLHIVVDDYDGHSSCEIGEE